MSGETEYDVSGPSPEDIEESLTFNGASFECLTCALKLDDSKELELAGLATSIDLGEELGDWHGFNAPSIEEAFEEARNEVKRLNLPDIELNCGKAVYDSFVEKIHRSYAVILVSLGDISPNMILDAIRLNRPFICTKEVGIYDRIKGAGIFVDPLDEMAIESAINDLLSYFRHTNMNLIYLLLLL